MKHLKRCRLKIHYMTLVYLIIAFVGNYLFRYLMTLSIVLIHELCHLLMAYCFSFQIEKIEILPFGAYLSLNDFYFHTIAEELCVVLAGPCCHLFLYFIFQNDFFLDYQEYLLHMNTFVFFFNCLPIYPMDGHRFLCLFLQSRLDIKSAMELSLKISVFVLSILTVSYLQISTLMIISYLMSQQFIYYQFIPHFLRQYFIHISEKSPDKKKKIHTQLNYRRGYENYYYLNHELYHEKKMIYELIKSVK